MAAMCLSVAAGKGAPGFQLRAGRRVLGRTHRFHGHKALNGVYRRGQTVRSQAVSLRIARRSPDKPYRVAVVVSRKVSKSAVRRNRIRRRVYAAVRISDGHTTSTAPKGLDLVFTVFDERLADVPATELQQVVAGLLEKAASSLSRQP